MAAKRPGLFEQKRPKWRWVVGLVIMAGLMVFVAGLLRFAEEIPTSRPGDETRTDAIVVLTGGSLRIESGVELLQRGLGEALLVSGVDRRVSLETLLERNAPVDSLTAARISLGYAAHDTLGNALETAGWVMGKGYRSIRVVTANYHMKRSLLEFSHVMPGILIVPDPVIPEDVRVETWWRWPGTAALIAAEYVKYLSAQFRIWRQEREAGRG